MPWARILNQIRLHVRRQKNNVWNIQIGDEEILIRTSSVSFFDRNGQAFCWLTIRQTQFPSLGLVGTQINKFLVATPQKRTIVSDLVAPIVSSLLLSWIAASDDWDWEIRDCCSGDAPGEAGQLVRWVPRRWRLERGRGCGDGDDGNHCRKLATGDGGVAGRLFRKSDWRRRTLQWCSELSAGPSPEDWSVMPDQQYILRSEHFRERCG